MPVEVIDLLSSPDLPRPAARATKERIVTAQQPAKVLTYEPAESTNHDWCVLSSDDISSGPPAPKPISKVSAKSKSNLTMSTKPPQSKFSNDFYFLTDDFDSTVNLDDSLNSDSPAAKKRRLSSSPKTSRLPAHESSTSNIEMLTKSGPAKKMVGKEHSYESSVSNIGVPTKFTESRKTTDEVRGPKTMKSALVLDPIIFTSSPDPFADAARRRRERKKDIWEESDESMFDLVPGNKNKGRGSALHTDGTRVLKSGHGNTLNDYTLDTSSDVELPDLKALPSKSIIKSSSKSRSALTVLEKYNAQKALEKKAKEKAEDAKAKLSSKEAEKERKLLAKEEKARQKENATNVAKVNTLRTDKKVSTPEMIVDLPSSLETKLSDQISTFLGPLQVAHSRWESSLPIIKWRRKVVAEYDDEIGHWKPTAAHIKREKHVMCVMPAKEFVDLATGEEGEDLDAHVLRLKAKFPSGEIIYLIEGLATWMKRNKNVKNRRFDREVRSQIQEETIASQRRKKKKEPEYIDEDMVEDALLRSQVIHGVLIHHTSSMIQTAEWVVVFTQHISTIPYRTQQLSLDTAFCMESGQVKAGDGPADTFVKMLQEILRITAPVAYGIAAEYPTVQKLVKGLEENGPLALEDFKKTANKDGAFTDRRVGPSLSKRVYNVFMGREAWSWDV